MLGFSAVSEQPISAAGTGTGTQALVVPLVTNTSTFYAATVSASNAILAPFLDDSSDTFYGPTVSASNAILAPFLDDSVDTFYGPTVSATYALTAPLVSNSSTFYASTVHRVGDIEPPLLENDNTFYAPTVFLQPLMASRYGSARRSESARGDRLSAATRSNKQTSRR